MKAKNVEDVYDLTPLQQGLLFHCLHAPSGGYYIEQMHFTIRGELRVDLVREVWQEIIARHPGLRTSFSWEDINRPVQVVHRTARLDVDEVDLRGETDQEAAFREHQLTERRHGFDLEVAPLLRLTIFRLADDTFRFGWQFSHLIMDGWSFGLVMSDFVTLYKARYHGKSAELMTPGSPRDYVGWWGRQDANALREHWTARLAGYRPPRPLDLGDRTPEVTDSVKHDYTEHRLGEFAARLQEFCRAERLTLNTVVQGAWTIVLSRCYGVEDIAVGATMSHRPADLPGCESIVGPLIVTLPIRSTVDPSAPAVEWLGGVQKEIMGARDHAGVPLPEIHGWSEVPRSEPLFETIVSYENVPIPEISFAAEHMEITGHDVDGRPQYPMSLVVLPGDDMPLRLVYDRRRFSARTADRMLARLRTALEGLVDAPREVVGGLEIMPDDERAEILASLRPREQFPVAECLHDIVREHGLRTPDRLAVDDLTYGELVARADSVARSLRDCGVGVGDRVGLLVDRSPEFVVGALGTLAAGAAYVPLDPGNPVRRLEFVLADSQARALVTTTGLADLVPQHPSLVLLDGPLPLPADDRSLHVSTRPHDIAYVMYTSGSTGEPKGVLVTHENVVRLVAGADREFGLTADDVWSQFFSCAFDGSTWEIWGALVSGARLVIAPRRDPERLYEVLRDERVTICTQSPSSFQQLIAAGTDPLSLRVVVLGGEKVEPTALRPWFDAHGDDTIIANCYGPTEATVWVCHHRVTAEEARSGGRSLIGKPLPDTVIELLDAEGGLVPLGAPGEMFLAGPGVAAGYLNREELSRCRFGADPMGSGRRYASGDLARMTDAGELEYLGRADAQVKIRGYRVELGEVENRLRAHPDVQAAVAVARDDTLLAYVVGPELGLKEFCAAALPDYMVPSHITSLPAIPLQANGKVDVHALPDPVADAEGAQPRTETERRIAEIMCEVLKLPSVAVDANLTDLGLHSLLATRVVSRIKGVWRVNIPLRALFEAPTVATLAALVEGGGARSADRPGRQSLADEVSLDLVLSGQYEPREARHVFVTGATGFVGRYLVDELLRTTDATVHCLVRGDTGRLDERVVAVPGDLSQPYLGLTREDFEALGEQVDEIYHVGAQVNFVHPYRRLRSANVGGTREVLRLAAVGSPSVVHHVSSVGILPDGHDESDLAEDPPPLPNGYTETKWVAERLVALARDRGLPVVIHRLGRITGDSRTGEWDAAGDALGELIRASAGLGTLPRFDGAIDMVPVDHAARAIVAARGALGRTFHHVNPAPVAFDEVRAGFERAGYPSDHLDMTDWYAELVGRAAVSDEDWTVAITLLSEWTQHARLGVREPKFASSQTYRELDVECPRVDAELLARYLDRLAAKGFIARKGERAWPAAVGGC